MTNPIRWLNIFVLTTIVSGVMVYAESGVVKNAPRPNIIVILADDMGFSDLGCYGSEIATPNLDKLAANGLRLTQFYNSARCCPSRASLLTGLYAHQAGQGGMLEDFGVPGYTGHLNDTCVTIAEALRPAGYFTATCGKWHVGMNVGVSPWNRGFDHSLSNAIGGLYFLDDKGQLYLDGNIASGNKAKGHAAEFDSNYSTDVLTDYSLKFIDAAKSEKKPFFLYLAEFAPHWHLQATPEDIAKWRGKFKSGWEILRQQRYEKQKTLGVIDNSLILPPLPSEVPAWDKLSAAEQDKFDHIMAIYAAVVEHMDRSIGRLVDALKQRGELDNTIIMFMSDNGASAEGDEGHLDGSPPGSVKSKVMQGQYWATLSNTPLRKWKGRNHEGGISTPLIIHWPQGIKAAGELRTQPAHLIDIMPTCVELAGATYPKEFSGKAILPMEGRSLVPLFDNRQIQRDALYWEHSGNAAVRLGDWKLVRNGIKGEWELYNIKDDRTESNNLAATEPERVKDLNTLWQNWAVRAQVLPYPGKKADKLKGKKEDE